MSKSAKADENLKDKLKNFFRINKDKSQAISVQKPSAREFVFTPEILKDIGPESPSNNRIKTIKELADVVQRKELEENAIEAVWCSIQDLVLPQVVSERRHAALHFLQCLLEGQYHSLGVLRLHFFNVIQSLTVQENLTERLTLFKILSENGRNLLEFEEETGQFLLEWMPEVVAEGKETDFLPLLISLIKFNAAYLDEDIVCGLVKQTCVICNNSLSDEQNKLSLDVLDAVVCYSYLPRDCLQDFVGALCRMVNKPKYCEPSWELMRKLLGTHLGHSSIGTMCIMLQERQEPPDYRLLRGAVFYIGMALWGSRKVPHLKHTPAVVLPSFLHVLAANSAVIVYEVILSVQRLVKKYGKELTHSTWNIILDILETALRQLEMKHSHDSAAPEFRTQLELHDTLTVIEQLNEQGQFAGSVENFFKIIEICPARRPETSVIHLISYESSNIHPGKEGWIRHLYYMLDKYFRNERRTKIRLKALEVLSFVLSVNKHIYEDDLINNVVLPHLCHIETDEDVEVRRLTVEILLTLTQSCSLVCFMDIISIVEKVMSRSLSPMVPQPQSPPQEDTEVIQSSMDETQFADVKTAVQLLVELFKVKLYSYPPGVCVKLYDMLAGHLTGQYTDPKDHNSLTASAVRKMITECLLDLRADGFHHVGFFQRASDRPLKYSPYVTCCKDVQETSPPCSPVTTSAPVPPDWSTLSYIEYRRSFSLFIQCLENEKDWEVLKCVLENLPILLQNKTIILSAGRSLVEMLSAKLCAMVSDRLLGYPEKLVGMPAKFTRSDFHAFVFPVLASMVTYHNYLERNRQKELIKCLEFGMVSKCAKLCVNALRLCTLEMQDTMMRLLPSVLLQLSKISATVTMAIPVLAFLSSIVRLPKMYANFVEDEYMSVFAIALPYTNPFKFSHYTVSLAHHVIAIWFIRCRLPFRRGFVPFIQKGLKANVLQQFEENARLALQNQNEDSSERGRSGSYSEAALRSRRRMQSGSAISRSDVRAPVDEKLSQFHRELTETCTDVMARYSFGNFSALPHRSHMADFLLAGGQTKTWLVGNKLITITTSGGGTKVGNSGVCDKCQAAYQTESRDRSASVRRRHKSAVVISRSSGIIAPQHLSSQDDMGVQPRSSLDDLSIPAGMVGQDVGVQTGSSLSESAGLGENEPLESFILGMKSNDPRRSLMNVCNCWCTNWAELYIRAPSGNLSWMMRIENESAMYNIQDSQVPDITMLFATMSKKSRPTHHTRRSQRIESGSIGEAEYESLYAEHFPEYLKPEEKPSHQPVPKIGTPSPLESVKERLNSESGDTTVTDYSSLGFTVSPEKESDGTSLSETHEVSQALQIPSNDSAKNHDSQSYSTGSLRRSNSSPSILSGSSDTLSPRESISDIVQIGPYVKEDRSEPVKKETDSDNGRAKTVVQTSSAQTSSSSSKPVTSDSADGSSASKPVNVDKGTAVPSLELSEQSSSAERKVSETNRPEPVPFSQSHKEYSSMLTRQLSPSPASSESSCQDEVGELPSQLRRRGHTIAVAPVSLSQPKESKVADTGTSDPSSRVGISPSFVFLQLYHAGQIQVNDIPLLLQNNETTERSIRMLDHIYPYETHKIGIIYVGPSQTKDEKAILANECGSERYMQFVQTLGTLYRLRDCNPQRVYLGGLNTNGSDGEFTYGWHDESTQLVFHIATLMPSKESDPNGNAKKLHIGNDYVTVVYNDSGEDYKIGVIKGQFNYVNIMIRPLDYGSNAVTLQAKEVPFKDQITTDIAGILGHTDTKIISDNNLAALVRQIAIHCNLASMVLQRQQSQPKDPFANNWLERLRKIRRMRTTVLETTSPLQDTHLPGRTTEDFTEYV